MYASKMLYIIVLSVERQMADKNWVPQKFFSKRMQKI